MVHHPPWGCSTRRHVEWCEFFEVLRRGFGTVFFEICFLEAKWSDDDDDDDDDDAGDDDDDDDDAGGGGDDDDGGGDDGDGGSHEHGSH